MAKISIIIRTKNEEQWLSHCLNMVFAQSYKNFEVIIVDNMSTDHTVAIAKRYPIAQVVFIEKFLPGKAINEGVKVATGEYLVCLSAHCVPQNENWLAQLLTNFSVDDDIAGVYGRQIPTSFTSAVDKRDLLIVFGKDKRKQVKDYFFHNANSMIPRKLWQKYPFDEAVTNIEDRAWAKKLINAGYKIIYEPEACVYHHHGLHQNNEPKRAKGVVTIIEKVEPEITNALPLTMRPGKAKIIAVLPIVGVVELASEKYRLIAETIALLQASQYLTDIYLLTECVHLAKEFGVQVLDRNIIKNSKQLTIGQLLAAALSHMEGKQVFTDAIIYMNYDYINKKQGIVDELIVSALYNGYDTVFTGVVDYGNYWFKNNQEDYQPLESSLENREARTPIYKALYGQGCLTATRYIRQGKLIGKKVGIIAEEDFSKIQRCRQQTVHSGGSARRANYVLPETEWQ